MKITLIRRINRYLVWPIILMIGTYACCAAQPEEAKTKNKSFDNQFRSNIQFENKLNPSSDEKIKPWHFSEVLTKLPSNMRNSKKLEVGSDNAGEVWTFHSENGTFAYSRKTGSFLYQNKENQEISVSPNGEYLIVSPEIEEGEVPENIYHVPEMTAVFPKPVYLESLIGRGRYGIINSAKGQRELIDLENPSIPIRSLGTKEFWHDGNVYESENGNELLRQDSDEMVLYQLPHFSVIKKFENFGTGKPFINGTGTVIGWNRGVICYFLNTTTDEVKGYGPDMQDDTKLVECKFIESTPGFIIRTKEGKTIRKSFQKSKKAGNAIKPIGEDIVTGFIDTSTLKITQTVDESEELKAPLAGKNYGVSRVICPPGSSDIWLVVNRSKIWKNLKDTDGDSLLVQIGEDLGVKKIIHYSKLIQQAAWDDETKSIINADSNGNLVQINVGN